MLGQRVSGGEPMLETTRREFIALIGGGCLLLAVKVKRAWGQQPAMPVVGFLSDRSPSESACRDVSTGGPLSRTDTQRREAGRLAGHAVEQIRVRASSY